MVAVRIGNSASLFVILLLASLLRAQTTAPADAAPTKEQALAAIAALAKDPLAANARREAQLVMKFAETSNDVLVHVDVEVLPFLAQSNRNRYSPVLLGSFVGGNVKSQLDRKVAEDDCYAGLQSVFRTYRAIRKVEPGYVDPKIDSLEALDKEGKLQAHIAEAKAKSGAGKS